MNKMISVRFRLWMMTWLLLCCQISMAEVKVTNVEVKPRWPWNGLVDIIYSIECDEIDDDGNPMDVYVDFTAIDGDLMQEIDMVSLTGEGANFPVKDGGPYMVTWDATMDAPNFHSSDLKVQIHAIAGIPPYLVINLQTWKRRYSSQPPNLENDKCRTTELWLRCIPAGMFIMGAPEDEVGHYNSDMVPHEVTISEMFFIGVFECTQKQWELVMGSSPSSYMGECRPVECVSYNMIRGISFNGGAGWPSYGHQVDSNSFMGKLSEKTGLTFDLPTEAQWEYACRAGTTTALNSGKNLISTSSDDNLAEVGRYSYNQSDGKGGYTSKHTKVGSYLPNAWGLYDMHGNVWEWCLDWWGADNTSTDSVMNPLGPKSGKTHVKRGGRWGSEAYFCRSASRDNDAPDDCKSNVGFRILCMPQQDLYAVIDLSDGPNADNYPIRYTNASPDLSNDACRTTELWLRKIQKGTFIMGSPEDELGRSVGGILADMSQHTVKLTQDFYIGVFECTQKQWKLVMGSNPSEYKGDSRPVSNISYDMIRGTGAKAGAGWPTYGHSVDASSFMGKLQSKTGLIFDLPTEAQWEYACRAGTTTALNSGKNLTSTSFTDTDADHDSAMDEVGRNRYNNSDGKGGYYQYTKVGSYLPNAWGLYDMHGNMYELTLDWWGTDTSSTETVIDPVGPDTESRRVQRGGCWGYPPSQCRSASRHAIHHSIADFTGSGFRIACIPKEVLYVVVDLSEGTDAVSYPVYYTDQNPELDDDSCRTTELWLRRIPAGTFTMGSPENEVGRRTNYDMAQHEVTLTQKFYVGIFECTQKQWELVMGNRPSYFNNDGFYATRPVEQVSFNMIRGADANAGGGWPTNDTVDASSFMGKLQAKTGLKFDLPTEAQWEYACRAGTTTALNSGKNLTSEDSDPNMDEVGRYYYNGGSDYSQSCTTDHGTAKVGSYIPNVWGLYDMHGNVAEWVLDWWGGGANSTDSVEDPKGPTSGTYRRFRGGYSRSQAYNCRSANRTNGNSPAEIGFTVGFRIIYLP